VTRILRIDARPDEDALLAREVLTLGGILGLAFAALALIHRLG
jgi:hypothetical protein